MITVRAGYTARTHNRWFSNWVAFREQFSRNAVAYRLIRIAPKRIVFEIPGQSGSLHKAELQSRFSRMGKRLMVASGLVVVALSIIVVLATQLATVLFAPEHASSDTAVNASSSQSPKRKPCVDLEILNASTIVENTEAFSAEGWNFESQSKLVSLGQLAAADYLATCESAARAIRVLFISHGKGWQIEKMAPTE
ncbi:MAG: hypothetical protein RL085_713 [Actinomycetota bacterium]